MKANAMYFLLGTIMLSIGCTFADRKGADTDSISKIAVHPGGDSSNKQLVAKDSNDSLMAVKDSVFKVWLMDTIKNPGFANSVEDREAKNRVKEITIDQDSTRLLVVYKYHLVVNPKVSFKMSDAIQLAISLLKRYKECPTQPFDLSVDDVHEFTPNALEFTYQEYSYLDNFQTRVGNANGGDSTITDYNYIRGRLGNKTVRSNKAGSSEKDTTFSWDGDKLIKK